jgi:hypothetical protein
MMGLVSVDLGPVKSKLSQACASGKRSPRPQIQLANMDGGTVIYPKDRHWYGTETLNNLMNI